MGIKIDTLPPALRAQVEAKLRAEDKRRRPASSPVNAHRIAKDAPASRSIRRRWEFPLEPLAGACFPSLKRHRKGMPIERG